MGESAALTGEGERNALLQAVLEGPLALATGSLGSHLDRVKLETCMSAAVALTDGRPKHKGHGLSAAQNF